jgi:hypothetical protein
MREGEALAGGGESGLRALDDFTCRLLQAFLSALIRERMNRNSAFRLRRISRKTPYTISIQ